MNQPAAPVAADSASTSELNALLMAISEAIEALVAWNLPAFQAAVERQRNLCDQLSRHCEWRQSPGAAATARKVRDLNCINDRIRLFSIPKSFSTAVTWLLTVFRSFSWPCRVVCCARHCVSGASAAVTAAFTAAVTSIPSELEPVATSSSELILIALDEGEELDPSNDARLDDDRPTELITQSPWKARWTEKTVAERKTPPPPEEGYWRSFRIVWAARFACCKAEMPVCCKVLYLDKLATVFPMLASLMPLWALVRF
jgi:hypothetical protein